MSNFGVTSVSWSTNLSAGGPNAGPSQVTYPGATIYTNPTSVSSGATAGFILSVDPAYNIYLDGDTSTIMNLYA